MDKIVDIDFQGSKDSLSFHEDFSEDVCIQVNQNQI